MVTADKESELYARADFHRVNEDVAYVWLQFSERL